MIKQKFFNDLALSCVALVDPITLYIYSLLRLVLKYNKGLWRIHHLSYLKGCFINNYIPKKFSNIKYINIKEVYTKILVVGHSCIIIKKDIKDTFKNILISILER